MAASSLTLTLTKPHCNHAQEHHPRITNYTAQIHISTSSDTGTIQAQLVRNTTTIIEDCRTYDILHALEAKLDKVQNYLFNESFFPDKQGLIDSAEWVLFVESAYIDPDFRGKGLSLLAVDELLNLLEVGERCVMLLQAGAIGAIAGGQSALEVGEKLTRHWRKMGFGEWSYTDDSWLCLSTAEGQRPSIEDVLSEDSVADISASS